MAKLKIELDTRFLDDYVDEYGEVDFDSFISDEIISQIGDKIISKYESDQMEVIESKITDALSEVDSKIQETIDKKVNEIAENLLNRNITIYDKWGDIKKENVNIMDMFKQKMDNFLSERVDENGKTNGYRREQTRIDYLVNKNITYSMERKVNEAAAQVSKKIEEYVNKTLKQQIGEEVSKVIGLDKITSKISEL